MARAFLQADRALGGLQFWQPPRLLGSHFRACTVSFTDQNGEHHSIEVQDAFGLHYACSVALEQFLLSGVPENLLEPRTKLIVSAVEPETEHSLSVQDVREWLIQNPRFVYHRPTKRATLTSLLGLYELDQDDVDIED